MPVTNSKTVWRKEIECGIDSKEKTLSSHKSQYRNNKVNAKRGDNKLYYLLNISNHEMC